MTKPVVVNLETPFALVILIAELPVGRISFVYAAMMENRLKMLSSQENHPAGDQTDQVELES